MHFRKSNFSSFKLSPSNNEGNWIVFVKLNCETICSLNDKSLVCVFLKTENKIKIRIVDIV